MSDLPKYERLQQHDIQDIERVGEGSQGGVEAGSGSTPVTTYSFYPTYPLRGSPQHIIGIQQPTKQQTITSIQQYFPALSTIPPSRISLKIPVPDSVLPPAPHAQPHPAAVVPIARQWADVTDDAWAGLGGDGLKFVKIEVEDGPGDARRRTFFYLAITLGPVFAFMAMMVMFAFLLSDV
jgi:hypothetical protein